MLQNYKMNLNKLKLLRDLYVFSHQLTILYFMRFIFALTLLIQLNSSAQGVFAPLNTDYYHLIDRYEIKGGKLSNEFHSNFKGYNRKSIVNLTEEVRPISRADSFNLTYLQNDSWEWLDDENLTQAASKKPIFKQLYKKKADFISYQNKDFDLHLNPVLHFGGGTDNISEAQPLINTRGVEVRGMIAKKVGFYSYLTENQITNPFYVGEFSRFYKGFPYEGFTKVIDSDSTKLKTDFFSARGYIAFNPIKQIQLHFGHDRNFVGSGIRSMILSDFSSPYLQLRMITHIGKVQYINIFGQLINKQIPQPVDGSIPLAPKYLAFHHLNYNVTKNLNIGLFETIIFGKRQIGFDLNYLNPIIFYRFVEGNLGSADNSMVGLDFKYNFLKRFSTYGQLVLDEFKFDYFKERRGWWGSKIATQVGLKYIDFLEIPNLDVQVEFNLARPYTYSHFSTFSNFANYNMPLAHPIGANFREVLAQARFQAFKKLFLTASFSSIRAGEDFDATNWGGNILRNYLFLRPNDFGNFIGQGRRTNIIYFDFNASYMLKHNLFLDFHAISRSYDSRETILNYVNTSISGGLRLNIGRRNLIF